jgi:hypothetical protein
MLAASKFGEKAQGAPKAAARQCPGGGGALRTFHGGSGRQISRLLYFCDSEPFTLSLIFAVMPETLSGENFPRRFFAPVRNPGVTRQSKRRWA